MRSSAGVSSDTLSCMDQTFLQDFNSVDSSMVRFPTTASTGAFNHLLQACNTYSRADGFFLHGDAVKYFCKYIRGFYVRVSKDVLKVPDTLEESDNKDMLLGAEKTAGGGASAKLAKIAPWRNWKERYWY